MIDSSPDNMEARTSHTYSPTNKNQLKQNIKDEITKQGNNPNLNIIDTSQITDMSGLFRRNTTFNGDISKWNVGKATDMEQMFFYASAFNQDISGWDVSKVTKYSDFRSHSALTAVHTPPKFR